MIPILLATLAAFFYAFSNVIIRKGLDSGTLKQAVFISLLVNTIIFWILSFLFIEKTLFLSTAILWFVAAGLFAPGLGRIFNFSSVAHVGVARTVPIVSISPLFSSIIAIIFLGEQFSFLIIGGILILIFGVYVVTRPAKAPQGEPRVFDKKALFLPLGAAICYGISVPFNKVGLGFIPHPILVATITSTTSLIVYSSYLISTKALRSLRPTRHALFFYGLSGLATVGAFLSNFNALRLGDVSLVAPVTSSFPLFAAFLSVFLLKERITGRMWLGAIIIVLGVVLVSLS